MEISADFYEVCLRLIDIERRLAGIEQRLVIEFRADSGPKIEFFGGADSSHNPDEFSCCSTQGSWLKVLGKAGVNITNAGHDQVSPPHACLRRWFPLWAWAALEARKA